MNLISQLEKDRKRREELLKMRKSTAVGMNESSEDPENVLLQNMITDRDEMGFGSTQQTNGSNSEIPQLHQNQMFDAY